jgi:hypothetical protein
VRQQRCQRRDGSPALRRWLMVFTSQVTATTAAATIAATSRHPSQTLLQHRHYLTYYYRACRRRDT